MQGSDYWLDCFRSICSVLVWGGTALTQLFYYPWLGSLVLIGLWLLLVTVLSKACPVSERWQWLIYSIPVMLLMSVTELGYWIYYLKQPGYFFRETLGYLSVALLLLFSRPKRWGWITAVLAAGCYPLLGVYSVLALVLIAVRNLFRRYWLGGVVLLFTAIGVPMLMARAFSNLPVADAWTAGFPWIECNQTLSLRLTLPFFAAIALLFALVCCSEAEARRRKAGREDSPTQVPLSKPLRYTLLALWLVVLALPFLTNRINYNFHAEMRIARHIDEGQWQQVLDEVDQAPKGPTRQMVVAKHIALLHTNHLLDQLFAHPNIGPSPLVGDSLPVHMAQTCAPQFYLYHGMTNDVAHWSIENSVEYGLTFSDLRYLALASLVSGEKQAALKYLDMLDRSWFYGDFVKRYYPLALDINTIDQYLELKTIKELHDDLPEYMRGDDGYLEWRIYRTFSSQTGFQSPLAQSAAIAYAVMQKEPDNFWSQWKAYLQRNPGRPIPHQFQEAAYLYSQLDPVKYADEGFNFDQPVIHNYQAFRQALDQFTAQPGYSMREVNQYMKQHFGNTFWYYYYFSTNIKVY